MQKIISDSMFSRHFVFNESFGVSTIGYHDFSRHYNPEYSSRVQNFYTLHFVLSGKGILKTGGKTYNISKGQMFFLPPNVEICYYPTEAEPWEYIWLSLSGNICEEYGAQLGFETPVKDCANFGKIEYLLKNMFNSLVEGGGYYGVIATFYEIMEISTVVRSNAGVELVKRIIDEGFTRTDFNITSLCRDVGISHPHLIRLFKNKYNITLIKYLNQKRIEYACELLKSTDLSVKSVAYSSGFSDELHFMKTFKKHMGISALKYKNKG